MRRLARTLVPSLLVHAAVVAGMLVGSPRERAAAPIPLHLDLREPRTATEVRVLTPRSEPREETPVRTPERAEPKSPKAPARRAPVAKRPSPSGPSGPKSGESGVTRPSEERSVAEGQAAGSVEVPPSGPGAIDLRIRPPVPSPPGPPGPPGLEGLAGPEAPERKTGGAALTGPGRYADKRITGTVLADGSLSVEDPAHVRLQGLGAGFDLGDEMIRLSGKDPFGYEKMKFERETRALRNELRDAACEEDLRLAVRDIRPRLFAIWHDARRSPFEKRRAIFKIWEDCAEDGAPQVVKTASLVREIVLDFIAENLPLGSALAYTPAELSALNAARHARAEFVPYGSASP